jgi:hypothetical protein
MSIILIFIMTYGAYSHGLPLIFFSSSLADHPKRLTMPRNTATAVTMTAIHKTPDTSARKVRFRSRNINTADQPHKMKTIINNKLKTDNSHFACAGTLLTFHVPIMIMVCHTNKKRHKSNKTTKKKRVSCEMKLLGFGSWSRSNVMALNVKPAKRDNIVIRDLSKALTYSVYFSSFSVTLSTPEEVYVKFFKLAHLISVRMLMLHLLYPI